MRRLLPFYYRTTTCVGSWRGLVVGLSMGLLMLGCVDRLDLSAVGKLTVVVVDGALTNLAEPQQIRLNRSLSDPVTGLPGSLPITGALVEVVLDSVAVITAHETEDGQYQLPSDFRGQTGHAYQLRFTLRDGTRYQSTPQVMLAVPPIQAVRGRFSPTALAKGLLDNYTAGHELFIDTQDPPATRNFYRWDWKEYEKQVWCRSCQQGVYAVNAILPGVYKDNLYFVSGDALYEDCFIPPPTLENVSEFGKPLVPRGVWGYDYYCRSQCWEILTNYSLDVFADQFTNGGLITNRKVAQIPFYTREPCLIEIRQSSLSPEGYQYFKQLQDQTQNTGGVADTPPTALPGNIRNVANEREIVVGYFTASAVSSVPYWLDRKDAQGLPYGSTLPFTTTTDPFVPTVQGDEELFYALNRRLPNREPPPPYTGPRPTPKVYIYGGPPRPPTAVCVLSNSRTPFKPAGWQN
ncbi:DUF4249 domain-containing protein [Spirosoma utsteinense]|uniref:DUF4249 domain-containing protein n=1 Tax=Spirosoma utsteinense TaxID=2585773 RepID=A0ABR6WF18_9BACT|nr:DUF4249 domain-containing protein [Spirosoma utsteinense]MBC3785687.1 hypothetical protein [Spirosoma utsteinense]MBC3795138.1 hypothetical protein [Spirosoma utsteinense]